MSPPPSWDPTPTSEPPGSPWDKNCTCAPGCICVHSAWGPGLAGTTEAVGQACPGSLWKPQRHNLTTQRPRGERRTIVKSLASKKAACQDFCTEWPPPSSSQAGKGSKILLYLSRSMWVSLPQTRLDPIISWARGCRVFGDKRAFQCLAELEDWS